MKLKKYSHYKDSWIDWIWEIPEDWEVVPLLKKLNSLVDYRWKTPKKIDDWVFLITAKNIKNWIINYELSKEYVDKNSIREIMRRWKPEIWDLLFTTEAPLGEVANIDNTDIALAQRIIKMRWVKWELNNYYLKIFISSSLFQWYLYSLATWSTALWIKASNLCYLKIIFPPYIVQEKIVKFLDLKTQQIEKLIKKDTKLIELLKERRVSLINRAVTKGIDENVEMKDSWVEWIGEIPEDWEVRKLKHLTKQIIDWTHFTPTYVEKWIPFLRVTDIQTKNLNLDEIKYIPQIEHKELSFRCKPQKWDLLLSKNWTIWIPKVIDWDYEFSIFVSLCLIKPLKNMNVNFLKYFFLSQTIKEQIFYRSKTTSVTNLHLDQISEFDISLPKYDEQQKITNFLDKETTQIDNHIKKVKKRIKLYEEYKKSLIYSVVTGKVEV